MKKRFLFIALLMLLPLYAQALLGTYDGKSPQFWNVFSAAVASVDGVTTNNAVNFSLKLRILEPLTKHVGIKKALHYSWWVNSCLFLTFMQGINRHTGAMESDSRKTLLLLLQRENAMVFCRKSCNGWEGGGLLNMSISGIFMVHDVGGKRFLSPLNPLKVT